MLAGEFAAAGRVLEVGVGTGLLALPLAGAAPAWSASTLTAPMLDRAGAKSRPARRSGSSSRTRTRLPFFDRAFGGAFIRHVLHLVPNGTRSCPRPSA